MHARIIERTDTPGVFLAATVLPHWLGTWRTTGEIITVASLDPRRDTRPGLTVPVVEFGGGGFGGGGFFFPPMAARL
jgi:hypothetical protein